MTIDIVKSYGFGIDCYRKHKHESEDIRMTILTQNENNDLITNQPMDQNPAAVYLASLPSITGRRGIERALDLIALTLTSGECDRLTMPWQKIRFKDAAAIRAWLVNQYSPATVNHALCALRGVLKAAWQLGQISAETYQAAAAVKSVRGSVIPAGRELSPGELAALMAACEKDTTIAGARDAAIIALMYSCGMRREEVVTINLADYEPENGKLIIKGKGSKERTAYLTNGALYAMADWLPIRGSETGALFLAINKGGKIRPGAKMTNQAIYNLLAKRAIEAGVKDFSPHDMRRTFVSDLLDAGADISTVSKMAGHASINTTARYDRRPEEAKKKAAGLLHIPYKKRV